jgi:hypothetical protein
MTQQQNILNPNRRGRSGTHFYLFDIRFESSVVGDR